MNLDFSQLNWLAVGVAAVAAFLVGGLWYGLIFSKAWIRLHKYSEEEVQAMSKVQAQCFALMFAADVVGAIVLSLFVVALEINTVADGLMLGGLAAVGFVIVDKVKENVAHRKPVPAFAIDAGYALCTLLVMGAILGAWR